jgi:hypothetical protein
MAIINIVRPVLMVFIGIARNVIRCLSKNAPEVLSKTSISTFEIFEK